MPRITATIREGRVDLITPVDWPDGTRVEIRALPEQPPQVDWLSLAPLDVGEFREPTPDDDLLAEMLDDSRN